MDMCGILTFVGLDLNASMTIRTCQTIIQSLTHTYSSIQGHCTSFSPCACYQLPRATPFSRWRNHDDEMAAAVLSPSYKACHIQLELYATLISVTYKSTDETGTARQGICRKEMARLPVIFVLVVPDSVADPIGTQALRTRHEHP